MGKQRRRQAQRSTLADQLRAAISSSGRSEYEIAADAGISQGGITRFMRGERDWTLGTADVVAQVLGLELAGTRFTRPARAAADPLPRRTSKPPATAGAAIADDVSPPTAEPSQCVES